MDKLMSFYGMDMYESRKYYNDVFLAVLEDIRMLRDKKYNSVTSKDLISIPFFNITDDDYKRYRSLLYDEQEIIEDAIIIIFRALLKREGFDTHEPKLYTEKNGRSRFRAFSIVYDDENGVKVGLKVLYDSLPHSLHKLFEEFENYEVKSEVDLIKVVLLEKEYKRNEANDDLYFYEFDEPLKTFMERINDVVAKSEMNEYVEFYSLDSFFISLFGKEEYCYFENATNRFNKSNRETVGYKTVFVPNEIEVNHFKDTQLKEVKDFDYKRELLKSIDELSLQNTEIKDISADLISSFDCFFDACFEHCIDDSRILVMFGGKEYADSFISSEWYYYSNFDTNILDKTAIAVGYLKSVEQLLYQLLLLHIDEPGYTIKHGTINAELPELRNSKGKYPLYIPFTTDYEPYFDITLGSLCKFVNHFRNDGIFSSSIDKNWRKFIYQYLEDYRITNRNDHLHKDNIYSSSTIRTIRYKTLLLYFLLLGSFDVSNDDLKRLGGTQAFAKREAYDEFQNEFYKWLDAKLEVFNSEESTIILSPIFKDKERISEKIIAVEVDSFRDNNFRQVYFSLNYDEDPFEYSLDRNMSFLERGDMFLRMIQNYIKLDKANGNIKKHVFVLLLYGSGYRIIK